MFDLQSLLAKLAQSRGGQPPMPGQAPVAPPMRQPLQQAPMPFTPGLQAPLPPRAQPQGVAKGFSQAPGQTGQAPGLQGLMQKLQAKKQARPAPKQQGGGSSSAIDNSAQMT